jgi:hypothetical protein
MRHTAAGVRGPIRPRGSVSGRPFAHLASGQAPRSLGARRACSGGPTSPVLEPTQLQHRPAEPEPLLHREAVVAAARGRPRAGAPVSGPSTLLAPRTTTFQTGPRAARAEAAGPWTAGCRQGAGLADPVAECCRQQSAEARDVLHRQPEGPDAPIVLPDAQHDQVPLRVPGDAQPSPALVEEHIPARRQCSRVLHRSRVVALEPMFKAPGPRVPATAQDFSTFLAGSSSSGFPGG